jgi:hypothetical protein
MEYETAQLEVTQYENLNKDVGHFSLEGIFDDIRFGVFENQIYLLQQMLREGNTKGYSAAKLKLPAITPSALFYGRRIMPNMLIYNHIIILDFDKLTPEELKRLKALICLCAYTFACFVSPSGNGLKVFVRVSTGAEDHKMAFLAVQQFYTALTGVGIDPSGKDITRLCFISYDPKLYYNPESEVFVPFHGEVQTWPPDNPGKPVLKDGKSIEIPTWATHQPLRPNEANSIIEKIQRCKDYVGRHCSFVEGQRHTFVFALAIQFRCRGFDENFALMELLQDYNFNEKEVRGCVKYAYSYVWANDPLYRNPDGTLTAGTDLESDYLKPSEDADYKAPSAIPVIPSSEITPPPPPKERKNAAKRYNLRKSEALLNQWYETRYNEVTGVVEWRHANTDEPFCRLEDHHENSMLRRLHHADQPMPVQMLHVLINSDYSPCFNPFISYVDSLTYEGTTDYIAQLIDTVKTDDDPYFAFCFRKWFVAYVASLVMSGVINQTVVVFVGVQGVGKTSWMKRLVPPALMNYLGTAVLQSDSKDTSIQLTECALIILDELENLNRKDLASFKELITRPEIRIRRPYGRNSENLEHRASFIAAVNSTQILTDPTGSRRYLCSKVNSLEYQHTVDIDGAFAQAYALYKSGFKFWFDKDEIRELTERNEDFMSKSVEEELIEIWLEPVTLDEFNARNKYLSGKNIQLMTSTQIALKLMEKAKLTLGDNTIVKIGKVLHKLGYTRIRKKNNYFYLVRNVDMEAVDKNCRTLDITETAAQSDMRKSELDALKKEQEENEQIIRLEEDLSNNSVDDELPF